MVIPDSLFYAALGPVAASLVWIARQFVIANRGGEEEPEARHGDLLTVRDYRAITALLDERYMTASELRDCFAEVNKKLTELSMEIQIHMAEHRLSEKAIPR